MHSYIEKLYPGYIVADFEELQEYKEELRYSIAAIYDNNLYNIEFNAETKKFVREYSEWKFSKLPQALQDALKAINSKVSDENTSAERVREENQDSTSIYDYQIDSDFSEFAGRRFDEKGNEL
jgi:TPP-dependent 2-oxoacid decarboxylase